MQKTQKASDSNTFFYKVSNDSYHYKNLNFLHNQVISFKLNTVGNPHLYTNCIKHMLDLRRHSKLIKGAFKLKINYLND